MPFIGFSMSGRFINGATTVGGYLTVYAFVFFSMRMGRVIFPFVLGLLHVARVESLWASVSAEVRHTMFKIMGEVVEGRSTGTNEILVTRVVLPLCMRSRSYGLGLRGMVAVASIRSHALSKPAGVVLRTRR